MARAFTYIGLGTLALVAITAACGGGGGDTSGPGGDGDGNSGDGESGDGDICISACGDGDIGDGDVGDGDVGDGDVTPDGRVIYEGIPVGFLSTFEDGSGNPTYLETGFSEATATTLAAGAAGGLTPTAEAVFFYPFPDTMVPGNLTFIELQWKSPDGAYENVLVRMASPTKTYNLYLSAECTSKGYCSVNLPKVEWQNVGSDQAGQTITIDIVSTNGTATIITQPLPLRFSPEPLVGALYYWASASRAIKRVSFGADAATDFIVPGVHTEYACVSCHSVSRDGSTIAFGVSPEHGENISGIQVAKTADPLTPMIAPTNGVTPFDSTVANGNTTGPIDNFGHNVALDPTGTRMAVNATDPPSNWPSKLEIRNTNAPDSVVATYILSDTDPGVFGINKIGIHPEYSPDGSQLVVTLAENFDKVAYPNENVSAWATTSGSIAILPVAPDGTLGEARVVSTPVAGAFHFYPTWSPDSKYVAFMTSWDNNKRAGSLGNDNAVLHMVPTAGAGVTCPGDGCLELVRGTGYTKEVAMAMTGATGSTWPKFAPFAQGANKNVYFITFTSRRPVGSRTAAQTQLWMFGIDTTSAPDMSFSPFWLPYQTPTDGSLAPYWTEVLPCDTTGGSCTGCSESEVCLVNTALNSCRCQSPPVEE